MKAAVHYRYGEPEVVEVSDIPKPEPGAGECLIRVKACSVNPADWKYVAGHWRFVTGKRFPRLIGTDFAGIVEAVGPGTTNFSPGDEVIGSINPFKTGAAAEFVVAAARGLWRKPKNMTFTEAAGVPIAGGTAFIAFAEAGRSLRGIDVLITGAGGGVGHLAVQLAAYLGARVTAVCSAGKSDFVRSLGAARAIDYTIEDVAAADERFDIILDCAAVYRYKTARPLLKPGGVYDLLVLKGKLWLFGVAFLSRLFARRKMRTFLASPSGARNRALVELFEREVLQITVSKCFPLAQTGNALRELKTGHATGKIVVEVG